MNSRFKIGMGLMMTICMLSGCGGVKLPEVVEHDSIALDKNGSITAYVIRDFNKDYYDLDELTVMARTEAADYNEKNGTDAISVVNVGRLSTNDSMASVEYVYADCDDYSEFNEGNIYFGTVADVYNGTSVKSWSWGSTVDFDKVKNVKSGNAADAASLGSKHIIVTDEKAVIYCPYGVAYLSDNAVLNDDGCVDTSLSEGTTIIIMKK